jgi:hypothetical protein
LFTKRLVTDHTDEFDYFPDQFTKQQCSLIKAELANQSSKSYTYIYGRVHAYATDECAKDADCELAIDDTLVRRITESVISPQGPEAATWQTERSQGFSVRQLLHGLYSLERIQSITWCNEHRTRTYSSVGIGDFAMICEKADQDYLKGLCLSCIRSGKACDCQVSSVSYASAIRFVHRDAYLLGAEPLPKNRFA